MKKVIAILMVLCMVALFAACSTNTTTTSSTTAATTTAATTTAATTTAATTTAATTAEKWTISLEYSSSSCEFCQNFADRTKEYGEAAGFNVLICQGGRSVTNQITNAENMLTQGSKILGGFWDDPVAAMPIMEACKAQDAWVIGVLCPLDKRANGYEKYRFVGSQNVNGGMLYGEYAAKNLPQNAKILELHGTPTDQQDKDRFSGFWQAMEKAGRTDVTVLDKQYTAVNREEGLKVTENWIQKYPEATAIISYSDELGCPAVEALKNAGLAGGKVQVYSFDGSKNAVQMIIDGNMMCSVLQDYKAQAQGYIDLCVSIRDTGNSEDMDVPFALITPENAESYLTY